MINLEFLSELRGKKLLLAFSHGSDSTALFYLLLQANISFDCALFNYKTRANSDLEEASAKELCESFGKRFFS
ncbi:MAG: ATP-binding protein, partial [Campylobacter sp.]|nr:ATP-binding protein [Campylobacter sp.]